MDRHDFLIAYDNGDLNEGAKRIPELRDYIKGLPDTAAVWTADEADIRPAIIKDAQVALLKSWPVPEMFQAATATKYVNPNYLHAKQFTDLIARCQCGAVISRGYEKGDPIQQPHNHKDGCKPQWRLSARAEIADEREQMMKEYGPLGWRRKDLAKRMGMSDSAAAGLPQEYGFGFTDLRDEYRRLVANTYTYFINQTTVTGEEVAEIYGHVPQTISHWRRDYGDDYDDGRFHSPNKSANQYGLNSGVGQ